MKVINLEGRKAGQLTAQNHGPAKVDTDSDRFRLKSGAALLRRVKLSIRRLCVLANSARPTGWPARRSIDPANPATRSTCTFARAKPTSYAHLPVHKSPKTRCNVPVGPFASCLPAHLMRQCTRLHRCRDAISDTGWRDVTKSRYEQPVWKVWLRSVMSIQVNVNYRRVFRFWKLNLRLLQDKHLDPLHIKTRNNKKMKKKLYVVNKVFSNIRLFLHNYIWTLFIF